MNAEKRSDAKIAGDGSLPGGEYGDVIVNGSGTINGPIDSTSFKVNGSGSARGDVKSEAVVVNGSASFAGSVQAAALDVNGQAGIHGGVGVGRLRVRGSLDVAGGARTHDADVRGEIKVGGDFETDSLTGEGRFMVAGMLNAGTIDFKLHGRSGATEIGGERIVVAEPTGISRFATFFADRLLVVDSIEADSLDLEWVKANVVRGGQIRLGVGCDVELVEYTGTLTREAGAQVREERKVELAKA
jgi:cytoskeletal protein CcmA (bactofilin family)